MRQGYSLTLYDRKASHYARNDRAELAERPEAGTQPLTPGRLAIMTMRPWPTRRVRWAAVAVFEGAMSAVPDAYAATVPGQIVAIEGSTPMGLRPRLRTCVSPS